MSIIYKALQKTQASRHQQRLMSIPVTSNLRLNWMLILTPILLLSIGLVGVTYLYLKVSITHKPIVTTHSVKPTLRVKVATPKPQLALALNGVYVSDQEKVAFINRKSMHIGEQIEGMKIIDIAFNRVVLENDGKTYILKL